MEKAPTLDILGPVQPLQHGERAVLFRKTLRSLPLNPVTLTQLVPSLRLNRATRAWAVARGTIELQKLIGGGQEQRTYRDWVVRRFGAPLYDTLYAGYCRKRFGEPREITCNIARLFHGTPHEGPLYAPAEAPARVMVRLQRNIEVRTNTKLRSITHGRVETDAGPVEGQVFVDLAPRRVLSLLGDPPDSPLANDVADLRTRHSLQVMVRCEANLPYEIHVLDGELPFFRITRPALLPNCEHLNGWILVHYALEPLDALMVTSDAAVIRTTVDALRLAGLQVSGDNARIQRIADQYPVWTSIHLVRLRRYLMEMETRGVTPVGRIGLHTHMDLSRELDYLDAVTAPQRTSLRECYRTHAEPPVLDAPDRESLRRFIER